MKLDWDVGDLVVYKRPIFDDFNLYYFKETGRILYNKISHPSIILGRVEIKSGQILLVLKKESIKAKVALFDGGERIEFLLGDRIIYMLEHTIERNEILLHLKKIDCKDE